MNKIAQGNFTSIATKHFRLDRTPEVIAKEGEEKLQAFRSTDDRDPKLEKEVGSLLSEYSITASLDTHLLVRHSIPPKYLGLAAEMIRQLEKQYNIEAPQDKAYIEIAVIAYCRYLSNTSEYDDWKLHETDYAKPVAHMRILSKDADRAFRQYHTIIQSFEAKTRPPIQVNVKANTAFISQNQQNLTTTLPDAINDRQ